MHLKKAAALAAILTLAAGASRLSAIPAYPGKITYTQSDGTRIQIRIHGDEFSHYVVSEEGYTLIGGPDGDYYYAEAAPGGGLKATAVKARPLSALAAADRALVTRVSAGVRPLAVSPWKSTMKYASIKTASDGTPVAVGPDGKKATGRTGSLKSLVLLVNFSDVKFITPNPNQAFHNLLNQDGYSANGADGSAWNFYHDNSMGQFDPQFDVFGPYDLSRPMDYYGGNNWYGDDSNARQMVIDACRLAAADGVDFSQYADGSQVRDIFVFYAGHNEAEGGPSDSVWPHKWSLPYGSFSSNGVYVDVYACSSELRGAGGSNMAGIGTFCHEFGHVLGWPDLYDTDYENNGLALGAGPLSLMDSGSYMNDGRTPPALGIFERWTAGWAEPQRITRTGKYTLEPIDKNVGYIVHTPSEGEYFLFENRSGSSVWNHYIINGDPRTGRYAGGRGLIAFQVDQSNAYSYYWDMNNVNAYSNHECYRLIKSKPAPNEDPNDFSNSRNWFFPGDGNVTAFTAKSTPAMVNWKRQPADVEFTRIALEGDNVVIAVKGEGGIEMTAQPSQFDAFVKWDGAATAKWQVKWRPEKAEQEVGDKTVTGNSLHLSDLKPATQYTVDIIPSDDPQALPQELQFVTAPVNEGSSPRFNALKSVYGASEYVTLSVLDLQGDVETIRWEIDGQPTQDTYLMLPEGEHLVEATAVNADGTKEHLVKYITVNK